MNALLLQAELATLARPEVAESSQKFFKTGAGQYGEGDCFRGVRVPVLRALACQHRAVALAEIEDLLVSKWHEDRMLALLLLVQKFEKAGEAERATIYESYLAHIERVNNWDLVDNSAPQIVGAFLRDKDRSQLDELARSSDLWKRRIAILATFTFIRQGDFADTLRLAELLIDDREDLIHKATGWMLREIGKRDPEAESEFLRAFSARMPRTMLRYAIEKFPPETRRQWMR